MKVLSLGGATSIKSTDTATDLKLKVVEEDGLTPIDMTDKIVEVVIGTDVGRVLTKTPTFQNAEGHVHFGFDNGDLIGDGDYHLEVHIHEGDEVRIAPSRKYYKLKVSRAIDEFQAEVTTVTLDYLLGVIEERAIQGPPGPVGPTGSTGAKGDKGEKGDIGLTGPIGPIGPTGLTGSQGPIGPEGPQGIQGIKGDKGETGSQGLKGDTGPQGLKGDTGVQGVQGVVGPIGPEGPKGDKGDTGLQGPKGDTGEAGTSFTVDATGTLANRSVYDSEPVGFSYLATDNGLLYIRQGAGWSAGIPFGKGDKGDKGDPGPQGIQGVKGDTGLTGSKGDQGVQGIQGPKGDIGPEGPQGIKGDTGSTGAKGDTGTQGIQGPKGDPGTTTWGGITDVPAEFPPSSHTHQQSEITGLSSALTTSNIHQKSYLSHMGYTVATGSNDTYSASLVRQGTQMYPLAVYQEGVTIKVKIPEENFGPSTINIDGLGPRDIVNQDGTPLKGGEMVAGGIYFLTDGGASFILQSKGGGPSIDLTGMISDINGMLGS